LNEDLKEKIEVKLSVQDDAEAVSKPLAPPELGPDYEVLQHIGHGGMGSVYKVRNTKSNSVLAIKVLKNDLCSDATALKRFQQEAKSLAGLDHPNLVAMYGHGQAENGAPYLVMDFVDGHSLADILKIATRLDELRALNMFMQLCEGLSHAHKQSIVHRDIKPSNIVLSPNAGGGDHVKLLDFGIARIIEQATGQTTNLTQTGDVFGTPAYMSPEQCNGQLADERSDVYSLGCVMYEVLTGRQLFQGSSPIQIALKQINEEPPPFEKANTKAHEPRRSLEAIVMKCLAKDESHRYQTVDSLLADLKKVEAGGTIKLRRYGADPVQRPVLLTSICHLFLVAMLLFSCMTICGAYGWNVGFFVIDTRSEKEMANLLSSTSLWLALSMTIAAWLDYVRYKSAKISMQNFWELTETVLWATTGWSGAALFGMYFMFGQNAASYHPLGALVALVFLSAFVLAMMSGITCTVLNRRKDFFKKQDAFSKPLAKKQVIAAVASTLGAFLAFAVCAPAPTSNVPFFLASLVRAPAPQLSRTLIDMSLTMNPKFTEAYNLAAEIDLSSQTSTTPLLDKLNKAIAANPEDDSLYAVRGKINLDLKNNRSALTDLSKAISINRKNNAAVLSRAELYEQMGDYRSAEMDYGKMISANPSSPVFYRKRSLMNAAMGNYDNAIADISNALVADEEYDAEKNRDLLRQAIFYDVRGLKVKANENYFLITQDGRSTHAQKAMAYRRLADGMKAVNEMQEAVKEAPADKQTEPDVRAQLQKDLFADLQRLYVPW